MTTGAQNHTLPFLTAKARLTSRYSISINEDDFIEKAFYIWKSIGNVATQEGEFDAAVPEDRVVKVPTDFSVLTSITKIDQIKLIGGVGPNGEMQKGLPVRTHAVGDMVQATLSNRELVLDDTVEPGDRVHIKYGAINNGDDGLPLLTDKEVEAIACTVALQEAERIMFTDPKLGTNMVQYLKPESDRLILAASIPELITNNDFDAMLDEKVNYDRKHFGQNFFENR